MINSELEKLDAAAEDEAVRRIVISGARGAIALAGIATLVVVAIWFAFYLLVFVPRASVP
jgi:fatty acid desaturase